MTCPHPTFTASVSVHRIGADADAPPTHIMAEVTVRCAACGVPFRFLGPGTGLSFSKPTVDLPATTLHAPIAPFGSTAGMCGGAAGSLSREAIWWQDSARSQGELNLGATP